MSSSSSSHASTTRGPFSQGGASPPCSSLHENGGGFRSLLGITPVELEIGAVDKGPRRGRVDSSTSCTHTSPAPSRATAVVEAPRSSPRSGSSLSPPGARPSRSRNPRDSPVRWRRSEAGQGDVRRVRRSDQQRRFQRPRDRGTRLRLAHRRRTQRGARIHHECIRRQLVPSRTVRTNTLRASDAC